MSNSLHNSLFLVASIYGIAVDILGLIASEIVYPWLSFALIVLYQLITALAIELLVCSGVGGCLCPISYRMILMYTASMYNPANSASVSEDITCLIMWAMFSNALLFGGIGVSLDKKKCPPAQLHALGLLR